MIEQELPRTKEQKAKAANVAFEAINKEFGKGTLQRLDITEKAVRIPSIPTGLITLDEDLLGVGGIPRGTIVEIFGPESSGKTTVTLQIIAEAQKLGDLAAFIDAEHALDIEWAKKNGVKVEDLLINQPDCYDELTEVLTPNGWSKFSELDSTTKIAQVHLDGSAEFVTPTKYYEKPYSGKMVHFTDRSSKLDLLVTPNHRMVFKTSGELATQQAKDIKYRFNKDIPNVAPIKFNHKEILTPEEQLLVAFQADGALPSGSRYANDKSNMGSQCNYISIRFHFSKKRKIDRLKDILASSNFSWKSATEPSRPNDETIYVKVPTSWANLKTFTWVNPITRSASWNRSFIEEVSYWDSCRRTDTHFQYSSCIPYNTDIVQQISVLAGYSTIYTVSHDKKNNHFNDSHKVSIHTDKNCVGGQSIIKSEVDFSGIVYCVKVPTGMILVRRNRKVAVSGNSGEQALEIAIALVDSGAFGVIVIDSVAALVPQAELDGEMGDSHMGLQARMMSQACRKLVGRVKKSNTTVIFINQIREKIGVMFGSPETTPGGRALKFFASVRLDIRRIGQVKNGDVIVGSKVKIKVVKNKVAAPFREGEFDLMYNGGLDPIADFIDYAKKVSIIEASGAWFTVSGTRLQGKENVRKFLIENPLIYDELYRKLVEKLNNAH